MNHPLSKGSAPSPSIMGTISEGISLGSEMPPATRRRAHSCEAIATVRSVDSGQVSVRIDDAVNRTTSPRGTEEPRSQETEEEAAQKRPWFVGFIVTRIDVPKQLFQNLVLLPSGQRPEVDRQHRVRGVLGLPILSPFHPVALIWMGFMLVFDLIYTAFWLPLSVAFCLEGLGASWGTACTQINFTGGVIYTLNFLISFHLGVVVQYDYDSYIIDKDGILLAQLYMRYGRFLIDIVGIIPFVALIVLLCITSQNDVTTHISIFVLTLSLVRLLRLVRLVSITKMIYESAMAPEGQRLVPLSVVGSYVIMFGYLLAVILNLEACIMMMVAALNGFENSFLVSLTWMDFVNAPRLQQWYCSLYWIITTATITGYGDISPKSIAEMLVSNSYMLVGLIIFGIIVGTISNATKRASLNAIHWMSTRQKIDMAVSWMNYHQVDPQSKKKIKSYLIELWETQDDFHSEGEIFSDLPHYLRQYLACYAMTKTVSHLKLFRGQDEELKQLMARFLRPVDIAPGSTLCEQGTAADRLWILAQGHLQASQYLAEPIMLTASEERPCIIGESMILGEDVPAFKYRSFTIRAELDTSTAVAKLQDYWSEVDHDHHRVVWELRMHALGPVLTLYPQLRTDLLNHVRDRTMLEVGLGDSYSSSGDFTSWCDASSCIARAMQCQPADLVELTMEALSKAKADDGSLQQLLDSLLEYSVSTSKLSSEFPTALGKTLQPTKTPPPAPGFDSSRPLGRAGRGPYRELVANAIGAEISEDPRPMSYSQVAFLEGHEQMRAAMGLPSHSVVDPQAWRPARIGRQAGLSRGSMPHPTQSLATNSLPFRDMATSFNGHG